jgi:hypothetical protein
LSAVLSLMTIVLIVCGGLFTLLSLMS